MNHTNRLYQPHIACFNKQERNPMHSQNTETIDLLPANITESNDASLLTLLEANIAAELEASVPGNSPQRPITSMDDILPDTSYFCVICRFECIGLQRMLEHLYTHNEQIQLLPDFLDHYPEVFSAPELMEQHENEIHRQTSPSLTYSNPNNEATFQPVPLFAYSYPDSEASVQSVTAYNSHSESFDGYNLSLIYMEPLPHTI